MIDIGKGGKVFTLHLFYDQARSNVGVLERALVGRREGERFVVELGGEGIGPGGPDSTCGIKGPQGPKAPQNFKQLTLGELRAYLSDMDSSHDDDLVVVHDCEGNYEEVKTVAETYVPKYGSYSKKQLVLSAVEGSF